MFLERKKMNKVWIIERHYLNAAPHYSELVGVLTLRSNAVEYCKAKNAEAEKKELEEEYRYFALEYIDIEGGLIE
jgi:hypothetical protein